MTAAVTPWGPIKMSAESVRGAPPVGRDGLPNRGATTMTGKALLRVDEAAGKHQSRGHEGESMKRMRWRGGVAVALVCAMVEVAVGWEVRAADDLPGLVSIETEAVLMVQIAGRFCEYERPAVKRALADVWNVHAVEFINEQGTLRVYYDRVRKPAEDMIQEVERALSFGLFCVATAQATNQDGPRLVGLLEVRR